MREAVDVSSPNDERDLLEWAEEFALVYELDLPRIAGKILGYLLVCDPATRTQAELAKVLCASRGSVSTMTRLLERFGWLERVSVRGQRQVCYRVREEAWARHVDVHVQRAHELYEHAVKARELLSARSHVDTRRIDVTVEFADHFRKSLPALLEEWSQHSVRP